MWDLLGLVPAVGLMVPSFKTPISLSLVFKRGSRPDVMSSGGHSVSQLNTKIKRRLNISIYLQVIYKRSSEEAPEGRIHSHN